MSGQLPFYHVAHDPDEREVRAALLDGAGQSPTYVYRHLTALLKWAV